MSQQKTPQTDPKTSTPTLPEGSGESAMRRERLEKNGGVPLTTPLEDGQLRGKDEEGRDTTGTHGGPKKDGSERK
jgi:hypothetical protein